MNAVISGASRGIGRGLAIRLGQMGYNLFLASRNLDELNILKESIQKDCNVEVSICSVDFSIKDEILEFSDMIKATGKSIDVLVNNVGQYGVGSIFDEDQLEEQLAINLKSAYYLSRGIAPGMKERQCGHIFNVCSSLSNNVRKEAAAYTISKHALKGFNNVLREELRSSNVKVTGIYPGSVNTSSWDGIEAPKEEFVQVEDIVLAVEAALKSSPRANFEDIIINPLNSAY